MKIKHLPDRQETITYQQLQAGRIKFDNVALLYDVCDRITNVYGLNFHLQPPFDDVIGRKLVKLGILGKNADGVYWIKDREKYVKLRDAAYAILKETGYKDTELSAFVIG